MVRSPLLAIVCANLCYSAAFAAFAGPYWLMLREVVECAKEEVEVVNPDLRASAQFRYNHTMHKPVLLANVSLTNHLFERGESRLRLDIARWDTVSGWREHFLVMPMGELCFLYDDVLVDIIKPLAIAVPGLPSKCPVSDGNYVGGVLPAQLAPMRHFPSLPYGRYKVYMVLHYFKSSKPKEPRACVRAIAEVLPKT